MENESRAWYLVAEETPGRLRLGVANKTNGALRHQADLRGGVIRQRSVITPLLFLIHLSKRWKNREVC